MEDTGVWRVISDGECVFVGVKEVGGQVLTVIDCQIEVSYLVLSLDVWYKHFLVASEICSAGYLTNSLQGHVVFDGECFSCRVLVCHDARLDEPGFLLSDLNTISQTSRPLKRR